MMMSTLPELPGLTYQVRGMVSASGRGAFADKEMPKALDAIDRQAQAFGANAIINVTVTRVSEGSFVVTGTAVVATATA